MRALPIALLPALLFAGCHATPGGAAPDRANAGGGADSLPFNVAEIARFDGPWALAFLPDGRMLVTEKEGRLKIMDHDRKIATVGGVPAVAHGGQGGLLDVALSPGFAGDHMVYLTYAEPGTGGSGLALARATLAEAGGAAHLEGLQVIWQQEPKGEGGQFGAIVAFAPDGKTLFLTSGERQRFTPAQDPDQAVGKILRLTLDGKPAPGNPGAGRTGAASVVVTDPPEDTEAAKTAPRRRVALAGANLIPAETWTTGHRNPYGLAFAPDGRLWETEMGPKGGDELNLIEPGRNYGWPIVSNGDNYDGKPIPDHPTRPEFAAPKLFWNPSISPSSLVIYTGGLFPQWKGSGFIGALSGQALIRVTFDGDSAKKADQWDLGKRIRFVAQGPDGALWLLEDGEKGGGGRLLRLTPRGS